MNLSTLIKQYFSSKNEDLTIDVFDEKNIYDVYQRVVGVLTQYIEIETTVLQAVSYCFYEILDNVLIHSGKELGTVITHYDPANHVLSFLVADDGMGVRESLSENEKYAEINESEALRICVKDAITDGKGFNYVFDAAGTCDTIITSLQVAANKANVCFIGTPTKPVELTVKMWELINRKEMYLTGSWMSYSAPWPGVEWEKTAEFMASNQLKIGDDMISDHYNLSEVKKAFKQLETNRNSIKGRMMLDI